MRYSKNFVLYLVICALGLGIIAAGITFAVEHKTLKDYLSSFAEVKEQNINLKAELSKAEEIRLRLENENKQLNARIDALNEFQALEDGFRNKNRQTAEEPEDYSGEYNALKEEYGLLQEAYNELLRERLAGPEPAQQPRGRELTSEQTENYANAIRERTYAVMDGRIAQARTDYEAGILAEIRDVSINLFDLQGKMRIASDEERGTLRQAIDEERRALAELYSEYNSYQWKTLAEQFKVENVEEFTKQAQELMQNRQSSWFGGGMQQRRNPPDDSTRR